MLEDIMTLEVWDYSLAGNTVGDLAIALAAFFVFLGVFKVFQVMVLRRLEKLAEKTETDIDDTLVSIVRSLRPPFYSFLAFYAALYFLVLGNTLKKAIDVVLVVWIVVQIVIATQILIDYIVRKRFSGEGAEDGTKGAVSFISGLLKATLWVIGGMLVLSNLGININSLIAGLGIGGIAIAFALQNILGDLFSSFAIHFDKPFRVGDFIAVGNYKGTVEKIGIKTTRIRSTMSEEIVISNTELTSTSVQNYGKMKERRNVFTLGITYETPIEKIKKVPQVVREAIESTKLTRFDRVHFSTFGDSSLNFDVSYYVQSSDYSTFMDVKQEINIKIMEAFESMGVAMAYPTRTVYVNKE
ncbi:MAG: mechanosensitive ion channel family protein [Patescibacteria group bacterium]|nr:MAG: mechanosensitive ion channel family protein [Patescibacteria group bacterium]